MNSGLRADHDDVVDDHADEVLADGVVLVERLGDRDLGADAIGRRSRAAGGGSLAGATTSKRPGESADAAEHLGAVRARRRPTSSARRRGHPPRCRLRPRRSCVLSEVSVTRQRTGDPGRTPASVWETDAARIRCAPHDLRSQPAACAASSASSRRVPSTSRSTTPAPAAAPRPGLDGHRDRRRQHHPHAEGQGPGARGVPHARHAQPARHHGPRPRALRDARRRRRRSRRRSRST